MSRFFLFLDESKLLLFQRLCKEMLVCSARRSQRLGMRLETAGTCFNQHRRSINSVQKLSDTPTELGTFARASGKIEEELESGHTRFPWKQSMPGPPSSSLTSYINELGVKVSYVDPNRMASGDSLEYLRGALAARGGRGRLHINAGRPGRCRRRMDGGVLQRRPAAAGASSSLLRSCPSRTPA